MHRLSLWHRRKLDSPILPQSEGVTLNLVEATIDALLADDVSAAADEESAWRTDCELAGQLCRSFQVCTIAHDSGCQTQLSSAVGAG